MYRSIIRTAIHRSDIQATTKQERPSSEVSVPLAQITPDISPSSICCFFKKFRQPFSLRILSRIPWTDPWTLFFNVSASRKSVEPREKRKIGPISSTTNKSMARNGGKISRNAKYARHRRWETGNEEWLSTIQHWQLSKEGDTALMKFREQHSRFKGKP